MARKVRGVGRAEAAAAPHEGVAGHCEQGWEAQEFGPCSGTVGAVGAISAVPAGPALWHWAV